MLVVSVLVGLPLSDVVAYRYAKIKRMMQSASVRYMETGLPKHLISQKPILIQEIIVYCHLVPYPIIQYTSSWPIRSITIFYYSFKIFSRFWLVKTKRIIHHNQLLNCHIEPMTWKWRQKCRNLLYWTVDRENIGTRLSCFGSLNKWRNCRAEHCARFTSKYLSKNIARTARSQLDGQHLLSGVYLQTWADLYLLNFPKQMHYRYKLNIDRGKHVLGCF